MENKPALLYAAAVVAQPSAWARGLVSSLGKWDFGKTKDKKNFLKTCVGKLNSTEISVFLTQSLALSPEAQKV